MVVVLGLLAARSAATTIRIAKSDIPKTFHELPDQMHFRTSISNI